MHHTKRVLFVVPYPVSKAPSQRFRVELFLLILQEQNINYSIQTFLDEATWDVLYSQSSGFKKVWGVCKGFLRRLKLVLFNVHHYDYIFIHREASPIGPPVFEFIISKVWRKKVIYDFDDAIWIPNTSKENSIVNWLKAFWKVKYICRWSYKVVGGNNYLCAYANKYNKNVVLIPTCVDVVNRHNQLKDQNGDRVVIGWTGSHSTMKYLNDIIPVFQRIAREFDVDFVFISNKAPEFQLPNIKFVPWTELTEITDLLRMNIGVMPLEDDSWSEGKCGFKLIQYMSLGIPAVASPVGVNKAIIDNELNGFLCQSEDEWYAALKTLIIDRCKRKEMGKRGRAKIVHEYSIQANSRKFISLFE